MGSRSVAKPLFTRSSVSNQQTKELLNLTSINTRNETTSDAEDEDITSTCDALPNLPPLGSTSNEQILFPARKEGREKKHKMNPEEFYMQSELREMGLDFNEIKKLVDKEFPPIQNHMAGCNLEDSKTNDNSS
ncbi:hypothetical protein VP01_8494g1 [Puccinia sorghi]|uniref:Uncharacterized protein n=1 Tax=Puccinia sorghi TaxID=27349 RepID=A0A0L6U9X3_9BASI|nr:hypothetical protein VP01_8494g1 [Puccinia sorghi]